MFLFVIKSIIRLSTRRTDRCIKKNDVKSFRKTYDNSINSPLLKVFCKTESVSVNGISAEWISFSGNDKKPVTLYLHGGGYVIGSIDSHRNLVANIVKHTGGRALNLNYRLAPEYPYPAGLEDAITAYRWLLEQKIKNTDIAVMGDSAGGGLAIAFLQHLVKNSMPLPACAVCLSPWTDLSLSGKSVKERAHRDPMITDLSFEIYLKSYVGNRNRQDPGISPLFGEMKGLPPLMIQVATEDRIHDDGSRLAERAKKAGVDVVYEEYDKMFHVFQMFYRFLPDAKRAVKSIGHFVSEHIK